MRLIVCFSEIAVSHLYYFSMTRGFFILIVGLLASTAFAEGRRESGKIVGTGTSLPKIDLSKPLGGWTVDQMVRIEGTISDPSIDPVTVAINGERYLLRTKDGRFGRAFPAAPGKNNIVVEGTNQAGTGSAERTVYAKIRPLPMKLVLTSDSDGIYTDLHIYEPKETVKDPFALLPAEDLYHVYWAGTSSPTGGLFYLNEQGGDYDRPGYGPYLYTHASPQVGIYQVAANYWPSGDHGHTVAYLNITLFGGTQKEMQRLVKIPLTKHGDTKMLAYIRIEKGGRGFIYAPSMDPVPKSDSGWPEWVRKGQGNAIKSTAASGGEGE